MRKNALQVLIPKFGLEGTVYLNPTKDDQRQKPASGVTFIFNEDVKNTIKSLLELFVHTKLPFSCRIIRNVVEISYSILLIQ